MTIVDAVEGEVAVGTDLVIEILLVREQKFFPENIPWNFLLKIKEAV